MTDRRWPRVALVALSGLLLALLLSWIGKAVCLGGEDGFWGQSRYCYSDIRILWSFRGFDVDAVPYAGAPAGYPVDYTFEYPPGLGFGAWFVGLLTESRRGFFNLTAVTLAASAIAAFLANVVSLHDDGRSPWRLLGWALSPALLLFGFQNWDLWAVGPAAVGVVLAQRGRRTGAGIAFGVGFALKWWPGLLTVLLLVGPWAPSRDEPWAQRLRPTLVAAGTAVLAQVPAILVSPSGWLDAHLFHARRTTNRESVLQGIHDLGQYLFPSGFWDGGWWTLVSLGTTVGLVAGLVVIARRLHDGRLDPREAALAIVTLFLLTSRVSSPQFLLWLLPFAVIARVDWLPVLAAEMLNAVNWLLYAPVLAGADRGFLTAAQAVAGLRRVVLVWLLYACLRERPSPRTAPSSASPAIASPPPVAGSGAGAG